ncbi:MAG: TRAP transporter small permease subunit [bacterium]|nr:TRAP transporter small permease subunit [bacterium]
MAFLRAFSRVIDAINERVGLATTVCTLLMVIFTVINVVMRYFFRSGWNALIELGWHMFGLVFLLGAAYTLKYNGHVRVDIFYARMSKKGKAWIDIIGSLFFTLPVCILIIVTSIPFAGSSWKFLEGSPDPGGLPARFILKTAIPVGFFLVALQGLSLAARAYRTLKGDPDEEEGS